jgi:uncharacterized protein YigE (DUF2233 family)
MARGHVLALLALLLAPPARALNFKTLTHAGHRYTVVRVDHHDTLGLFNHDAHGVPYRRLDRLAADLATRYRRVLFAMNAGMYEKDLSPVGLFIADGHARHPLNTWRGLGNFCLQPNGVFLGAPDGYHIVATAEYPLFKGTVRLATQSGPLLLHRCVLNARLAGGISRHVRNGVGVPSPDTTFWVISEDSVTLFEFAAFFRDALHCPAALYLDGNVSSLYAPALKRNDQTTDLVPLIAVTERAP